MRLDTKADIASSSGIIHSLDSCTVSRAADLLGCKISDLLLMEEAGKITLYFNFEWRTALVTPLDLNITDPSVKINAAAMDGMLSLGGSAYMNSLQERGGLDLDAIKKMPFDQKIPVMICGMWDARQRYIMEWNERDDDYSNQVRCQGGSQEKCTVIVSIPGRWEVPPVDELHIMGQDLVRLHEAITKGIHIDQLTTNQEVKPKTRESNLPFIAIVKLLRALKFTDEDFRGSIPKLRAKLANKGVEGDLTQCDKTLISWLIKAGVR